jgi:hypothetical protein
MTRLSPSPLVIASIGLPIRKLVVRQEAVEGGMAV